MNDETKTKNDSKNIKITIDDKEFSVIDEDELEFQKESDNVIRINSKTYHWKDFNILQKLLAVVFITIVLVLTAALIILVIIPIGIIVVTVLAIALAVVLLGIPIWLVKSIIRRK